MVGDDPVMGGVELTDADEDACNEVAEEDVEDYDLDKVPILLFPCRVDVVQLQHLNIFWSLEHLDQSNNQRNNPDSLSDLHNNSDEDNGNSRRINEEIEQPSRV